MNRPKTFQASRQISLNFQIDDDYNLDKAVKQALEISSTIEKKLLMDETGGQATACFSLNATTAASTYNSI